MGRVTVSLGIILTGSLLTILLVIIRLSIIGTVVITVSVAGLFYPIS